MRQFGCLRKSCEGQKRKDEGYVVLRIDGRERAIRRESCTRMVMFGVALYKAELKDCGNVGPLQYCYGEMQCSVVQKGKSESCSGQGREAERSKSGVFAVR